MCLSGYVLQVQCFWDEDAVDPGMDSSFPREFVFPAPRTSFSYWAGVPDDDSSLPAAARRLGFGTKRK